MHSVDCCLMTESLFFELFNVENRPKFNELFANAQRGNVSREEFARKAEQLEFPGIKRTLDAFDRCKATWGCDDDTLSRVDGYRDVRTFDEYFHHSQTKEHTDVYRTEWDAKFKRDFERRHPPHR
jgi:hypothetical protein